MPLLDNKVASTSAQFSQFLPPDDHIRFGAGLLEDFEFGGTDLQDPSDGLRVKVWRAWTDGTSIYVQPQDEGLAAVTVYTGPADSISECSLSFDTNMNYAVCWIESGVMKFKWFDSTVTNYTVTTYADGSYSPRLCLDDKRSTQAGVADILFFYLRAGKVYVRVQRDRYTVEYEWATLPAGATGDILACGMNKGYRVQLQMRGQGTDTEPDPESPPTDPGTDPVDPTDPEIVPPRNTVGMRSDVIIANLYGNYPGYPASPGQEFQSRLFISNSQSGITEPIPAGAVFTWGYQIAGFYSGSTLNPLITQTYTTESVKDRVGVLTEIGLLINTQPTFMLRGLTATVVPSSPSGPYLQVNAPPGPEVWWSSGPAGPFGFGTSISGLQLATFTLSGNLKETFQVLYANGVPWVEGERIEIRYGAPSYEDATVLGTYTVTAGNLAAADPGLSIAVGVRDMIAATASFDAVTVIDPIYLEILDALDPGLAAANQSLVESWIARGNCFGVAVFGFAFRDIHITVRTPL